MSLASVSPGVTKLGKQALWNIQHYISTLQSRSSKTRRRVGTVRRWVFCCVTRNRTAVYCFPTWVTFADRLWSPLSSRGWCRPVWESRCRASLSVPDSAECLARRHTCSFLRVSRHCKRFSPGESFAPQLTAQQNRNSLSKRVFIINIKAARGPNQFGAVQIAFKAKRCLVQTLIGNVCGVDPPSPSPSPYRLDSCKGFRAPWWLQSTTMTSWRPSRSMPSLLPASWVARCRVWWRGPTVQRLVRFVVSLEVPRKKHKCNGGEEKKTKCRSELNTAWMYSQVVEEISKVQGVKKVLVAQHDCYKGFLPGE